MVAVDGSCCPVTAVLDGQGHCCEGTVDVCGICQGNAWTVDVQVGSVAVQFSMCDRLLYLEV
jgi:hypothetical protein